MSAPRVVVVDDNLVVRSGLISLLEASGVTVAGEAGDGETAIGLVERLRPDLVLLDVQMPLLDGVSACASISRISRVIMLTYTQDPDVIRGALNNGASGYLVHGEFDAQELTDAVRAALDGGNPLSPPAVSALVGLVRSEPVPLGERVRSEPAPPKSRRDREEYGLSAREADVINLVAQGRSNGEIASRLFLSEKTVKNHINRIYAKLGVVSRGAAIATWLGTIDQWENTP